MMEESTFFSICGAPKAGTTSLHKYLGSHPQICMSDPKETNFFQHNYDRGWAWFESCFNPHREVQAFGEASPGNMIHPKAAHRIAQHRPDACLIFVLRNPIERAYSQHLYSVMRGTTIPKSFSALIRDPEDEWGRRMLELGLYHEQLVRFEEHFSRDQLWVGLFRELKNDNQAFVRRILDFLDVDPTEPLDTSDQYNTTRYPHNPRLLQAAYKLWDPIKARLPEAIVQQLEGVRSSVRDVLFQSGTQEKPSMAPEDRAYLREYYQEPNRRLEGWLGRNLSHWT